MINILLFILTTLNLSWAQQDDHCSYFKYCGSNSSSQSSSKSHPSTSIASAFNPSNISKFKGIGLETLVQPNNSLGFNLASGTGKFGGALISPTLENGFFGNRSIELEQDFLQRRIDKKRYKSKKLSVALGINIVRQKKFTFDLGVSLKRHSIIKKINPGIGISSTIGFLNLGYSYYKDDSHLELGNSINPRTNVEYAAELGGPIYREAFSVQTFSIGTRVGNLSLDYGRISTEYKFYQKYPTGINIYSAAYNYGNFLFNIGYRQENSPNMKEENQMLVMRATETDFYFGTQYLFSKYLVLGIGYNTYLLNEISGTVTIFL